ncbi:ubiquinone biosynthesis protein COQ9, mitochondrial isoform X2 [Schistocerca serialis cubense]|uniref:ubiquinone biosynthesis protein COQ9, mitochondrial isoform X2 n=2 Tax=Schistocerca serialis cubense TaxID=2023355 RepID=UPI00214F2317|nr:ubiquinone biosynthesis protein COQ9, mitochondrial isoform X2 [Schistocerca serialis cubense]
MACAVLQKFAGAQKVLTFQGVRGLWATSLWRHSRAVATDGKSASSGEEFSNGNVERMEEQKKLEDKILTAALPYVLQYGWTKHAIAAGAESVGYPGVAHGLFPRGGAHLVEHFYASCNQKLAQHLENEVQSTTEDLARKKPTSVFVNDAVEYRLRMIGPYLEKWPQAVGIMTLPPNVPTALANLLTLVDDICYYAGDRSVDFGWYTRRISLAGIYKMTELYMIQDKSDGFQETWQFLRRRIDDAERLHSYLHQSEEASSIARETATAAFITARNILGLNKAFR